MEREVKYWKGRITTMTEPYKDYALMWFELKMAIRCVLRDIDALGYPPTKAHAYNAVKSVYEIMERYTEHGPVQNYPEDWKPQEMFDPFYAEPCDVLHFDDTTH